MSTTRTTTEHRMCSSRRRNNVLGVCSFFCNRNKNCTKTSDQKPSARFHPRKVQHAFADISNAKDQPQAKCSEKVLQFQTTTGKLQTAYSKQKVSATRILQMSKEELHLLHLRSSIQDSLVKQTRMDWCKPLHFKARPRNGNLRAMASSSSSATAVAKTAQKLKNAAHTRTVRHEEIERNGFLNKQNPAFSGIGGNNGKRHSSSKLVCTATSHNTLSCQKSKFGLNY